MHMGVFDEDSFEGRGCSICGLSLKDGIGGKDIMGKDAHMSCIKDSIESGVHDLDAVSVLELNNEIYDHSLCVLHPDVQEEGCAICEGELVDTADLVSRHPLPKFAHRHCIYSKITKREISGESIHRLLSMNNQSDFLDWFNKKAWVCNGCNEPVMSPIISPLGDLYHKECMKREIVAGRISSWDIIKTCEINGMLAEDLATLAPTMSETTEALVKEAKGILKGLWTRFVTWLEEVYHSAVDVLYGYDRGQDFLDEALALTSKTASLNKVSIEPDVQQAMEILLKLEKLEAEHAHKVEELQALYQIKSLTKAKTVLGQKIKDYILTLASKQRKFENAIFRLKAVTHRESVGYKDFVEALRAAYANQSDVTAKINELLLAATKGSFDTQEIDVLMDTTPSEVSAAPAPVPAAVPERQV